MTSVERSQRQKIWNLHFAYNCCWSFACRVLVPLEDADIEDSDDHVTLRTVSACLSARNTEVIFWARFRQPLRNSSKCATLCTNFLIWASRIVLLTVALHLVVEENRIGYVIQVIEKLCIILPYEIIRRESHLKVQTKMKYGLALCRTFHSRSWRCKSLFWKRAALQSNKLSKRFSAKKKVHVSNCRKLNMMTIEPQDLNNSCCGLREWFSFLSH